ncbi:deoxyribose-phosphate aldolase [Nocardia brasiliensis]|uniref:deoxyribose-phosphate aldolase n=1 Tax=Nocardia brasiliensis TaxID=37326 RepID=UPI002457BBB7|nr:deoxyribose-phosphate aldolase [Nocardia brasiliensis]
MTDVAEMIDHSLLRPELTVDDVVAGCELAKHYQVASVCVRPCDVALASQLLSNSGVLVGTVVGFPHGASTTDIKVAEARAAVAAGAHELDMVLNIGRLRCGDEKLVASDIAAVVNASPDITIKVIFENAYLTDAAKIRACRLAEDSGAHYVKTSTGFAPSGATLEDVRLMRAHVSPHIKVKAAGGVRTLATLFALFDAGATRFGATATATILDELGAMRAARDRAQ